MAIEGASPEEAYTQLSEIPDTYLRVISKIPRFAATPLLWEASYARDAARLISPRSRSKRQILQAMYEARNPETATIAAETFGASSVSFCLELLNHGDYSSQTDRWLSAVSRTNQALLLRAIGRGRVHNIKALARVADCVPYDHNSTGLNRDEWASGIEHVGREPDVISLCVFLLTRALSGASPEPAKLLYFSFAPVHDSVRWSSFDADLWRQLAQSLPSVPGYKEWDRCYQVRLAVIEGFVKGTFPVSAFFQIAKTNNSFSQLVDTARGLHEGKNLLYSAAQLPPPSTRAERRQWRHVCDIVERNWFWDD